MKRKLKIISWYLFFIYFFGFLVISAIMAQVDPAPRYHIFGWVNKIFADLAFWTTQTNWMFFIFFLFVALNGKWGLWRPGKVAWINFLAYFTLTMALFWSALSATLSNHDIDTNPLVSYANAYDSILKWFITVTTHLVTYIIALSYYFIAVKKEKIDISNWYKNNLLKGWIYPVFYLIFVMTRMIIMNNIGSEYYISNMSEKNYEWLLENDYEWVTDLNISVLSTPYFFFNLSAKNGLELFTFGVMGCLFLITACQYLMIWINNLFVKEKNIYKENKKFEVTYEEKILSIIKICINLVLIGLIIYMLTKTKKYNFKTENEILYDFVYLFLYIFALILNITSIVYTFLKIIGKYKNSTIEFLSSLFSGLFTIQFYVIPILIVIPLKLENYYEYKKISSNK